MGFTLVNELPTPAEILEQFPLADHLAALKKERDEEIKKVITGQSNKFLVIFSESVKEVDSAGNILVIKCYTGMANAVCAALDTLHWNGVVGTIAGDDTMLAIMRDDHNARELVMQLRKMMSASN